MNSNKADMSVEDRYYTHDEYHRLSAAKKKGLTIKRSQRGHKKGAKDSKTTPKKEKKSFNKRVVAAVKTYLNNQKKDTDDESDEEVPMKTSESNRDNKALKRKQT